MFRTFYTSLGASKTLIAAQKEVSNRKMKYPVVSGGKFYVRQALAKDVYVRIKSNEEA